MNLNRLTGFNILVIVLVALGVLEHLGSEALKVYERTHTPHPPAVTTLDAGVR